MLGFGVQVLEEGTISKWLRFCLSSGFPLPVSSLIADSPPKSRKPLIAGLVLDNGDIRQLVQVEVQDLLEVVRCLPDPWQQASCPSGEQSNAKREQVLGLASSKSSRSHNSPS